MSCSARFCFPALFLLLSTSLNAQLGGESTRLYRLENNKPTSYFGQSVANAGDVNADGWDDILIGAPYSFAPGSSTLGTVYVYSGIDGQLLQTLTDPGIAEYGLRVAGPGDLDHDGHADIMVASVARQGRSHVRSGATGAVLFTFSSSPYITTQSLDISGAGDVNRDGTPDLILGGGRHVRVFSGTDGSELFDLFAYDYALTDLGQTVSAVGDWNHDGYDDFLAGAAIEGAFGAVLVFSGANAEVLARFDAANPIHQFGISAAWAGDLNQDGCSDIIVGAPNNGDLGEVFVYSGQDQQLLYRLRCGLQNVSFGTKVAGNQDLDGDRIPDILVAAPQQDHGQGAVYVFSGATGELRAELRSPNGSLGFDIDTLSDLDGDGLGEFLSGVRNLDRAIVNSFKPFLVTEAQELVASTGGTVRFKINFPESEATLPYAVLTSGSGMGATTVNGFQIPLGDDVYLQNSLNGLGTPGLGGAYGNLDSQGDAFAWIQAAPGEANALIGRTFYFAAISYDAPDRGRLVSIPRSLRILP